MPLIKMKYIAKDKLWGYFKMPKKQLKQLDLSVIEYDIKQSLVK